MCCVYLGTVQVLVLLEQLVCLLDSHLVIAIVKIIWGEGKRESFTPKKNTRALLLPTYRLRYTYIFRGVSPECSKLRY